MDKLFNSIYEFYIGVPQVVWNALCVVAVIAIYLWWRSDQAKREHRNETRGERMARLKQDAIEKLRAEKTGRDSN